MPSCEAKRQQLLAQLGQDRPVVAGSLNRVERKDKQGRSTVYHLLTFKEGGKTRSVYVPKDMVQEVNRWIRNYRRVRKLLADTSTLSIAIIRNYVPERRAAAASGRAKPSGR
jgi:intergrase/recombinase